jgi:hypothetical protein
MKQIPMFLVALLIMGGIIAQDRVHCKEKPCRVHKFVKYKLLGVK